MNKLLKTIVLENQITLSVLETTDMVNDAIKYHNLSPVCAGIRARKRGAKGAQKLDRGSWKVDIELC